MVEHPREVVRLVQRLAALALLVVILHLTGAIPTHH